MHFVKLKGTGATSIIFHCERGLSGEDYITHSNECIDKSKTHLNYSLLSDNCCYPIINENGRQRYKRVLDGVKQSMKDNTGKSIRKDAVTLCSWIVTVPKDLPEDKHEAFFKGSFDYLAERYGIDNVVSATVHNDETTPHLHFAFVPIVKDEKKGFDKLRANNLETPSSLKNLHRDMQKYLTNELECSVNLLNGSTINGNKSIQELKSNTLKEANEALQAKNEALARSVEEKTEKALSFDVKKKSFFESKDNYESRKQLHEQATAVKLKENELNEREKNIDIEIEHRSKKLAVAYAKQINTEQINELKQELNKCDETIRQQAETIRLQNERLKAYEKYNPLITKYKNDKRRSDLAEASRNNNYTFANDEFYNHSL